MKSYCCPEDNKAVWFSVFLLEAEHLRQRELRADVSIQNKERLWTARHDLISEVIDAPSGAQRRVLLQIPVVQIQQEQRDHYHRWDANYSIKNTFVTEKL